MSIELENRTYIVASKVVLPRSLPLFVPSVELDDCCEPYMVCALNGGERWETDKTSAWIKLFSAGDSATFNLYKDGVLAGIQPTPQDFVNDDYSKYVTVDWVEVLNQDGVGCYTIEIDWEIGGVTGTLYWGEYKLVEFSSDVVEGMIKISTVLNSKQSIEDIDFTGSNVVDDFRCKGYFGDRQPKMVVDNIIYNSREMNKVTRENLNEYTLYTKGLKETYIRKLTDLWLLSENQLYVSDFNTVNPSYNYLDFPAIVAESPEIKYFEMSRISTLTVKLNDKVKNSRSYY